MALGSLEQGFLFLLSFLPCTLFLSKKVRASYKKGRQWTAFFIHERFCLLLGWSHFHDNVSNTYDIFLGQNPGGETEFQYGQYILILRI